MLTNEDIVRNIESAFAGRRCIAEIMDDRQELTFRVIGRDGEPPLVEVRGLALEEVRSSDTLRRRLVAARELFLDEVERRGETSPSGTRGGRLDGVAMAATTRSGTLAIAR